MDASLIKTVNYMYIDVQQSWRGRGRERERGGGGEMEEGEMERDIILCMQLSYLPPSVAPNRILGNSHQMSYRNIRQIVSLPAKREVYTY